jgi:hypothetical protein
MSTEIKCSVREAILEKIAQEKALKLLNGLQDVYNSQRQYEDHTISNMLALDLMVDLSHGIKEHREEYIKVLREHGNLCQDIEVMMWIIKKEEGETILPELYASVMARFEEYNKKPFDFYHQPLLKKHKNRCDRVKSEICSKYEEILEDDLMEVTLECVKDPQIKEMFEKHEQNYNRELSKELDKPIERHLSRHRLANRKRGRE